MATTFKPRQTLERPLTIADYESFSDDGNRYEIIGGRLFMSPAPLVEHQRIISRLVIAIGQFLGGKGEVFTAPIDVQFSDFDVVQPDIVVVLKQNAQIIEKARIVGAPDLVVEVISPSSLMRDRVEKAALYARNGVSEYWLVDPVPRTFDMLALHHPGYAVVEQSGGTMRSRILDGFEIDLEQLFQPPI